jgi:hypothetical protein
MKKNISKQKRQPDVPDPQKRVLTIDGVAEALRRLNGNQAAVGRAFGVTRSSVNEFIKNHPELKSVEQECKQSFIDNVESAIYSQALKGNVTAQIFILKTIGKDRGYVERNEYTGKDGEPLFDAAGLLAAAERIAKKYEKPLDEVKQDLIAKRPKLATRLIQ